MKAPIELKLEKDLVERKLNSDLAMLVNLDRRSDHAQANPVGNYGPVNLDPVYAQKGEREIVGGSDYGAGNTVGNASRAAFEYQSQERHFAYVGADQDKTSEYFIDKMMR